MRKAYSIYTLEWDIPAQKTWGQTLGNFNSVKKMAWSHDSVAIWYSNSLLRS